MQCRIFPMQDNPQSCPGPPGYAGLAANKSPSSYDNITSLIASSFLILSGSSIKPATNLTPSSRSTMPTLNGTSSRNCVAAAWMVVLAYRIPCPDSSVQFKSSDQQSGQCCLGGNVNAPHDAQAVVMNFPFSRPCRNVPVKPEYSGTSGRRFGTLMISIISSRHPSRGQGRHCNYPVHTCAGPDRRRQPGVRLPRA